MSERMCVRLEQPVRSLVLCWWCTAHGVWCVGLRRCGKPYDGENATLPMKVKLVNNSTKNLTVKAREPCVHDTGAQLAKLSPGEAAVVTQDFIVVTSGAAGDPFDLWFGGGGWRSFIGELSLRMDPSSHGYIDYVIVSQN